ncbi:MAG: hypothetical protein ACREOO_02530 [bacterium]
MASYLLATSAAWVAAALVAFVGHEIVLSDAYKAFPGWRHDEKTARRRRPLYVLGCLAFALVLVYLLHLVAPVAASWQTGLQLGVLAGLLVHLPRVFEQFARYSFPSKMIMTCALLGIVQSAVSGVAAGLVFSLWNAL